MNSPKMIVLMALSASTLISALNTAKATDGLPINKNSAEKYTLSVIGDVPYGTKKIDAFPQFIDFINSDPKVDIVVHVGDIKNGSTVCADDYFQFINQQFERLKDPLVYTPGDNEWTDCHPDFVENVMWMESKVVFTTLNVPGSNDDSLDTNPWSAPWNTSFFNALQANEQVSRDAANLDWVQMTFEIAEAANAEGVVLFLQADMWDGTTAALNAYPPLETAIGNAALAFGKPVLMVVGDSHVFTVDNPYDPASPKHSIHPGTPSVPNITRIIVQGSTTAPNEFEYVRLTINPRAASLFSWERVPMPIP